MKNKWIWIIGLLAIVLLLITQEKKEFKKEGGEELQVSYTSIQSNFGKFVKGTTWAGQSFIPQNDFQITKVKLYGRRSTGMAPGKLYVGVRENTSPGGVDLIIGEIDSNTLLETEQWFTINMPGSVVLNSEMIYYLAIRAESSTDSFGIYGSTVGGYPGGMAYNAGPDSYWGALSSKDHYFEIWGITTCTPSCSGKVCGDNGCGGSCESCLSGYSCESGLCIYTYSQFLLEKYAYINGGSSFNTFITNANPWIGS